MKYINHVMTMLGYALSIAIVGVILAGTVVSVKQGMEAGTLLNDCEVKYDRPCELIAVPKEGE